MSVATVEDLHDGSTAQLQGLLHKREYHLAELIDEVVFAEKEQYRSEQEARCLRELVNHLEEILSTLLQYHIAIHQRVLKPALVAADDSSDNGVASVSPIKGAALEESAEKTTADHLGSLLEEPRLSDEIKVLLKTVLQPPKQRVDVGVARSPSDEHVSSSRPHISEPVQPVCDPGEHREKGIVRSTTNRAIIISNSLLQNQATLAQLLQSIQEQAEAVLQRWAKLRVGGNDKDGLHQLCDASHELVSSTATSAAPFRLEALHRRSSRAREIEKVLRAVEEERETLQAQLHDRESCVSSPAAAASPTDREAKEAWEKERAQLKKQRAEAQQLAAQEQALRRELQKRVVYLEKMASAPPTTPSTQPVRCSQCDAVQAQLQRMSATYCTAKEAWKAEELRLTNEILALRCEKNDECVASHVQKREAAAQTSAALFPSPSSCKPAQISSLNPAEQRKECQIGQLEATVAAMKADVRIMEMRASMVQEEREAERRRLLAAHERERERLQSEKEECLRIIDAMSQEIQGLSRLSTVSTAILSPV